MAASPTTSRRRRPRRGAHVAGSRGLCPHRREQLAALLSAIMLMTPTRRLVSGAAVGGADRCAGRLRDAAARAVVGLGFATMTPNSGPLWRRRAFATSPIVSAVAAPADTPSSTVAPDGRARADRPCLGDGNRDDQLRGADSIRSRRRSLLECQRLGMPRAWSTQLGPAARLPRRATDGSRPVTTSMCVRPHAAANAASCGAIATAVAVAGHRHDRGARPA